MRLTQSAPMDLGDIVSTAWTLCIRHWRPLLAMGVITGLGSLAIQLGETSVLQRMEPAAGAGLTGRPLPLGLIPLLGLGAVVVLFNQLALIRFGLEVWLGAGARVRRCYATTAPLYLPFLAAALIAGVVLSATMLSIILIPVALYLLVSWFFIAQICVTEGAQGPLRALGRSRILVRGSWWRTAAILAGLTLLSALPALAVYTIPTSNLAGSLVLYVIGPSVAAPFLAASQTLLYLDLRLRKHERVTLAPGGPAEPLQPR